MRIRKWSTLNSDAVYRTPIFDLHRRRSGHPHRGQRDFFIIEAPSWINIIPLTRKREVVMVRQFRHGIGRFTLEIPGGMVDPEDASPKAAARREMIEESGYDSKDIIALGKMHPNPAIQPNICYSYLARNVSQIAKPVSLGAEETEVVLVPVNKVRDLIATGKITHALVIAAFSFFHVYKPPRR
ncbi:MAG TPA: NUDIX hydrolase [Candidatus Binataceae bacterium]